MGEGETLAEVFDSRQEAWSRWQATPWGRLRYDLVARLLDRHLPPAGSSATGMDVVLDVGGGDGADSVRLAAPGRTVVVADPSTAMLARARARAAQRDDADVRLVATGVAGLAHHPQLRAVAPQGADVVLCHHVLQYCDDVDTSLTQVVAAARPGAVLSVMASNPVVQVLTAAVRDLDPAAALRLLDAPTTRTPTFDCDVRRITWQQVMAALERAGCTVQARYGVLCVNHLVVDDERKHDPGFAADLARLELQLAGRDPYRDVAAMWLVVARR